MLIRLGVTFHSVFYAPFTVARQRGLFEQEGLDLRAETLGDGRLLLAKLERGELDAGIGGIMRSLVSYDRGERQIPIHFARINDRDGFFLLGRSASFDWPDLLGRRLLIFAEAPTPWYVMRGLLRERGLDPDQVEVLEPRPAPEAAEAFRRGEADFLEAPGPIAEALVRDGAAVIVREMAAELGPLPYSSYCARPEFLEQQPERISALARAHIAALAWMQQASAAEIWQTIQPAFAAEEPEPLARAVARYQRLGIWSGDATLPRASYDRLADLLLRGGLIQRIAPYELVCRDDLTRAALSGA
jgi:NitT/TauT family transport system substrate-binding protein